MMISALLAASCKGESADTKEKELQVKEAELKRKEEALLDEKRRDLEKKEKELEAEKAKVEKSKKTIASAGDGYYAKGYGRYPEASSRYLQDSDVRSLSSYDLKIMRNEIFARHGFIFKTDDMRNYFSAQSWYRPMYSAVTKRLTTIEKWNVDFIKGYE